MSPFVDQLTLGSRLAVNWARKTAPSMTALQRAEHNDHNG